MLKKEITYQNLINKIGKNIKQSKKNAYKTINRELIVNYWKTGKYIVEYEQDGNIKAEYGKKLLLQISKDLKLQYGKGFSKSNLFMMRLFYIKYPQLEEISTVLSWSHYYELLKINNDLERQFYEKQSINENWSIRELRRQKSSSLFLKLAQSKDKKAILDLKIPDVKHQDIGQMNMYLGYFAKEENEDNEPIGILLTREQDEIMIEYATYKLNSNLFVSEYQLYLPDIEELKQRVEIILNS